jgi:hypothetical protein
MLFDVLLNFSKHLKKSPYYYFIMAFISVLATGITSFCHPSTRASNSYIGPCNLTGAGKGWRSRTVAINASSSSSSALTEWQPASARPHIAALGASAHKYKLSSLQASPDLSSSS